MTTFQFVVCAIPVSGTEIKPHRTSAGPIDRAREAALGNAVAIAAAVRVIRGKDGDGDDERRWEREWHGDDTTASPERMAHSWDAGHSSDFEAMSRGLATKSQI
ncbi:MAG: hypothetical protein KKC79_12010 [Gammaproteobacteria bacterium]|nr:hypothetical protein [Gammaproteobacteria bacterium]